MSQQKLQNGLRKVGRVIGQVAVKTMEKNPLVGLRMSRHCFSVDGFDSIIMNAVRADWRDWNDCFSGLDLTGEDQKRINEKLWAEFVQGQGAVRCAKCRRFVLSSFSHRCFGAGLLPTLQSPSPGNPLKTPHSLERKTQSGRSLGSQGKRTRDILCRFDRFIVEGCSREIAAANTTRALVKISPKRYVKNIRRAVDRAVERYRPEAN